MSAIICLPVDFQTNSLSLPSLLTETIDSAPVLYHTISRLTLSSDYRVVLLFVDGPDSDADLARAKDILHGLPCEYLVSAAPDVPNRDFLRRARLFSFSSWRGGLGSTSWYDEFGRPKALLEAAEKFDADTVGLISPDSPYADPLLSSDLLAWHYDRIRKALITVTGVPPGLAPAFFNIEALKGYASSDLTISASIAFKPSYPQRDLATTEAHFEADIRLRLCPLRLTAHSPRQIELMRALSSLGASPKKASALDVVETLSRNPQLSPGPVPAKIEIEPTTRIDAAPIFIRDLASSRVPADLSLDAFTRIVSSLSPHPDTVLTLEGLGEPLLNPATSRFVAAAKDAGLLGVHLATFARTLDDDVLSRLTDARLDILSAKLFAHSGETYKKLFGADCLDAARAALEKAFTSRRDSACTWPLTVAEITKIRPVENEIEPFFDYWLSHCDWPVIRPYNDYAASLEDLATIHMRTSSRIPCRKIFTELFIDAEAVAWPCRQDVHRTQPLGCAADTPISALWRSPFMEELRAAHLAGDYDFFPPCRTCKDWYYSL